MKYSYDLHIHSVLSPCAEDEMTPNNIVNMAYIKGLDIIAVSDHNNCGNVRSVIQAAEQLPLTVVPAMELETSEEVHVLCLFKTLDDAMRVYERVRAAYSGIKNKPEIFGKQQYMDSEDNIIGIEEELLVSATSLSINGVFDLVSDADGVAVPAHIDKSSYSVISNLGFIPEDINVSAVEIREISLPSHSQRYSQYNIITDSDAHMLENISEAEHFMELPEKSACAVVEFLKKNVR